MKIPAILVLHNDRHGAIASVTSVLADNKINIGHMEVSRRDKGKEAMMIIETDQRIPDEIMENLEGCEHILSVISISE